MVHISETKLALKAAVALLPTVVVLQLVAFSTNHWVCIRGTGSCLGLWRLCLDDPCTSWPNSRYGYPDWQKVVQAMATVGLLLLVTATAMVFLFSFVPWIRSVIPLRLALLVTILSGACIVTSLVVFGQNHLSPEWDLSWSFGLEIVSLMLMFVTTTLLFLVAT